MISRNNPQIWKIAEWLYSNCNYDERCRGVSFDGRYKPDSEFSELREIFYDKALELLKKINENEFVGEDNHKD